MRDKVLVKSLDRALDILEEVAKSNEKVSVTQLSRTLGLHKSTVYRFLNTFAARGYFRQDRATEKYEDTYQEGNLAYSLDLARYWLEEASEILISLDRGDERTMRDNPKK